MLADGKGCGTRARIWAGAVGTRVTPRPPHRPGLAAFPHPVPTLDDNVPGIGAWAAHTAPARGETVRVTRQPGTVSGSCRAARPLLGRHAFPPPPPPPVLRPTLFGGFLGTMRALDFSGPYIAGSSPSSGFPARPGTASRLRATLRSPRFRRVPFVRERVFDRGRASAPRLAVPHMLPSTGPYNLGLCDVHITRLNSRPHTITVYASSGSSPTKTQHSLLGGPLRPYPGGTCTRRNSPASPGASWTPCPAGTARSRRQGSP